MLETPKNLPKKCEGSEYVYKYYGHMITSDLSITSGIKLLKIFFKRTKFGERKCTDFKKSKTIFVESIDDCINIRFPKREIFKKSLLERWTTVVRQIKTSILLN